MKNFFTRFTNRKTYMCIAYVLKFNLFVSLFLAFIVVDADKNQMCDFSLLESNLKGLLDNELKTI